MDRVEKILSVQMSDEMKRLKAHRDMGHKSDAQILSMMFLHNVEAI